MELMYRRILLILHEEQYCFDILKKEISLDTKVIFPGKRVK